MLGAYRYLLALMVTVSHLWYELGGWSGTTAVFAFYLVSGYLMTSILHHSYGFSGRALGRYALNRFLRIFPTYWAVFLLSLLIIAAIPKEAFVTNFKLSLPRTLSDWLPNLFIFGLLGGPLKVPVPPAWSLDIELVFYCLMGLGLSRNRVTVVAWFAASAAFTCWLVVSGAEFVDRYAAYTAASLPFSIGAMVYMFRDWLWRRLSLPVPIAAAILFADLIAYRLGWLGDPLVGGFYGMLLGNFLMLVSLSNFDAARVSLRWRRLDRLLGNIAYPLFLCHWQVSAIVLALVFDGVKPEGGSFWLCSVVFFHLMAVMVYYLVDFHVDRLREKVRGRRALNLQELMPEARVRSRRDHVSR